MKINLETIKNLIPDCCDIDTFDISLCSNEEQQSIKDFLPDTKTVVVFGHHIESSIEWMWFPSKTERRNNNCAADLHLKTIVEKVAKFLSDGNIQNVIIPYPGSSGIQFKKLAAKTVLGELGDSYLFLHNEWGPWIHLRVLLTEADVLKDDLQSKKEPVCIHCQKCLDACPGKAIGMDYFDGLLCDETQDKIKIELQIPEGYIWKCEQCLRACPIGKIPEQIYYRSLLSNEA